MINFVKEIIDTAMLPISETLNTVSFTCVGGKTIVINNYVKIITYTDTHIVLRLKDDNLVVDGTSLSIRELNKNDICLSGDIVRVYFENKVRAYEKTE